MVGYRGMHHRVSRANGPATARVCIVAGCERQGAHWAWNHQGPSALSQRGELYGLDIDTYQPMCHRHHRWMDMGGTLTHCPQGHERTAVGVTPGGQCRGCHDRYNRERKNR